jgi:hypothetical protein
MVWPVACGSVASRKPLAPLAGLSPRYVCALLCCLTIRYNIIAKDFLPHSSGMLLVQRGPSITDLEEIGYV